ncbi:MAG: DUF805 domain-containing protein [Rhizomicrobium sp.]|jgi:uncharacterized membrane protein YhaH (DUF805 family)
MGQIDFNKLWQNFLDTVTNHYFDMRGRVSRAQFWYYVLVEVVIAIGLAIIQSIAFLPGLLTAIFGLAMLLPNVGMATRRMQDTGRSAMLVWVAFIASAVMQIIAILGVIGGAMGALGFLIIFFTFGWIISLIAIVAGIAVIYFCVQPGTVGPNQFGPEPAVWSPGAPTPAAPTV